MTRDELVYLISEKLQKQMHMINSEKQRANPKMLCDNLALRVMTEIDKAGMVPVKDLSKESKFLENTYNMLKKEGIFDWDLDQDLLDMIEEDKETMQEVKKIEDKLGENK